MSVIGGNWALCRELHVEHTNALAESGPAKWWTQDSLRGECLASCACMQGPVHLEKEIMATLLGRTGAPRERLASRGTGLARLNIAG